MICTILFSQGQKEEDNLTKDETEVAKYLRWNMPTKKSTMYGDEVQYFLGKLTYCTGLHFDMQLCGGRTRKWVSVQYLPC